MDGCFCRKENVLRCSKIFEKIAKKHPWWIVFISKIKKDKSTRMFFWTFSRIFRKNHFVEHFRFLNCVLTEWTVIYLFFGRSCVFWVFFTSVRLRVTLALLAINVEKLIRWRLQTRLPFACLHWKKYFSDGGEKLLRRLSIQSTNKFLKNRDQNSLDTKSFSAIFQ